MPRITGNRPNIPVSALKGQEIKAEDKVASTKSHDIDLATEAGGFVIPDFKIERRDIADPAAKSQIIEDGQVDLTTIKTAADFKTALASLTETHKAFLSPTKAAFLETLPEADRSNFAFINIVGRRNEQFFDEVMQLVSRAGLTGDEAKEARKAVNLAHRDAFRGRSVDFDRADTGSYWSYGHDAPFVHVFESMLESLPEDDPKRAAIQAQIDFIFTHKYVDTGGVDENNAEKTMGLIAMDKDSRHIVSMKKGQEHSSRVSYETLQLPASVGGEHAGKYAYRSGDKLYFEGSKTEVPAELADKLVAKTAGELVFRRADNEEIRTGFRYDWNGNRMLDVAKIDTGWWGHCDIKALMETLLADMSGSKGVTEYRSDTDKTTEFSKKMQLEALAALLNFDDVYLQSGGGSGAVALGETGFAGARFDDRPTKMNIKTNRGSSSFTIRLKNLEDKDNPGTNLDLDKAFALKVADDKNESFKDNDSILRVEQGDTNYIDGSGRKLEGTTDGYTFDDLGRPVENKQAFTIDLANVPDDAEKILIGTELTSIEGRQLNRIYLDPKTKELSSVSTAFKKNDEGKYVAEEGTSRSLGTMNGLELGREMTAGDDIKGKIAMLEEAVRKGDKIATDSSKREEVWNGEVHAIKLTTEWRSDDGLWERVGVRVDATFGSGKVGSILHKLDEEGNIVDSHEISAAVDFYWKDRPRVAPLVSERGRWYINKGMYERGVLSLEGEKLQASLGAMNDLSDLIYLGLRGDNKPLYTIVHDGKRLVYDDKAAWEADVKKLKGEDVTEPGGGTTEPGKVKVESKPDLAIPDADPAGVADTIQVDAAGKLKDIQIDIDLKHTYVGDLQVVLVAPTGDEVTLHKRGGRSRDDIVGTYGADLKAHDDLKSLVGKEIKGDWQLKIVDMAGQDVGSLKSWALNLETETVTE